ncbi:uncharacterized protein Tco025E_08262 [Trypanosoma conorhini]|uniref:Uncharacterized protein n=1 Tax=Trypanosoma conorhini TaxID=83891 RepID=A0A422ND39_9TRYP|nr:uncharacterized protein Tco025E_08262 [Trypanosoma conorhini]RNF03393.1 hypothetical protein Tco025E_08262 [Trypanosoma conorhini]
MQALAVGTNAGPKNMTTSVWRVHKLKGTNAGTSMPKEHGARGTGFEACNAQGASKPLSTLRVRRFRSKASAPSSTPLQVFVVVVGRSHGSRVTIAAASFPRGATLPLGRAPPLCPLFSLLNLLDHATPARIEVRHRRESPRTRRGAGTPAPGALRHCHRCGGSVCPLSAERGAFSRGTKVS